MTHARARLALLCALAICAAGAIAPTQASAAWIGYYNCDAKPVGLWCDGRANGTYDGLHSWDTNKGWFAGTWDDSVIVCEHLWRPATGYELPGAACAYNWVASVYGDIKCICLEAEVRQYSTGPRDIWGEADADAF